MKEQHIESLLSDVLLFLFYSAPILVFMSIFLCQLSLKRGNQGIFFRKLFVLLEDVMFNLLARFIHIQ